jgi:hypothetical protein
LSGVNGATPVPEWGAGVVVHEVLAGRRQRFTTVDTEVHGGMSTPVRLSLGGRSRPIDVRDSPLDPCWKVHEHGTVQNQAPEKKRFFRCEDAPEDEWEW